MVNTEIYIQNRNLYTKKTVADGSTVFPFTYNLITKIFRGLLRNAVDSFGKTGNLSGPPLSEFRRSYYMESARKIFKRKTAAYARKMGVTYGRITIREQKTRWGSCTSEGNLNFNWRLIFAPEKVLDYVVVHELSHRKEMNHSPAFYAVVASVMPEYKACEKWLRDNGATLWQNPSP